MGWWSGYYATVLSTAFSGLPLIWDRKQVIWEVWISYNVPNDAAWCSHYMNVKTAPSFKAVLGGGGYLILFRAANETDFRSKSFRWEYKRHSCADVPSEKEEGCARPVAGQRIPGTWFNAFKVPFKQSVTWRVRTFMTRYYKLIDILQSYFYIKIFIKDHHVPSDASILSFKWEARHFLNESQDNDKLI